MGVSVLPAVKRFLEGQLSRCPLGIFRWYMGGVEITIQYGLKLKTKVFERNCCLMFFQACWWAENMIALLFKRLAWRALYVIYPTNVGSLLKLHCTNVVYMQHSSLYTLRQEHSKTQWWSSDLSRLQWRDREDLRFLENSPETLRLGIKFMLKRVTRWGGYVGVHPLF